MKNNPIFVSNINVAASKVIIALMKPKKSDRAIEKVLAELIRLSKNGTVEEANSLHEHFKKLGVPNDNYRQVIKKLKDAKIISKNYNSIILCKQINAPIKSITIKQAKP